MQDLAVIPILLLVGFMASSSSIESLLAETAIKGTALVIIMLLFGKYLLQPFFEMITKTKSDELFIGTILFLAIGASFLAHGLGFSYSLGAFIAGMLIAETEFRHQVEADLIPFRDLLLGIFFMTVGMQVNIMFIQAHITEILLLTLALFVVKLVVVFGISRFTENNKVSLKTALALTSIGEFSLALLEIAKTKNLVDSYSSQILVAAIVLSMISAPLILRKINSISIFFFGENTTEKAEIECEFNDHIVLFGYGTFTKRLISKFTTDGTPYVVIEKDLERFQSALKFNVNVIFGNAFKKDVLRSVNIEKARFVVIPFNDAHLSYNLYHILTAFVDANKIIINIQDDTELHFPNEELKPQVIVDNKLALNAVLYILKPDNFFDF